MPNRRSRVLAGTGALLVGVAIGLWRAGIPAAEQGAPIAQTTPKTVTQEELQQLEATIDAIAAGQQAMLDRLDSVMKEAALIKTRSMRRRVP